jgi:hypothetical protein
MIAGGDDIDAGGKDFVGDFAGDAGPAGGVFAVGDDEIESVLLAEFGEEFLDRAPARLPYDIANEKKVHAIYSNEDKAFEQEKREEDGWTNVFVGTPKTTRGRRVVPFTSKKTPGPLPVREHPLNATIALNPCAAPSS